jgi:hypothetical protein
MAVFKRFKRFCEIVWSYLVFQNSLQLTDFKRCALLADMAKAKLRRRGGI